MLVKKFNQAIIKLFGNTSISTILIVPFVVQVVGATGLVGYLSFRTGKSAIADLANQLIEEVSDRVYQNLDLYLAIPHQINNNKLDAIKLGFLEINNLDTWEEYLWRQVQHYPYINFTSVGNYLGDYRTGERLSDGTLMINLSGESTNFDFYSYYTDSEGNRTTVALMVPQFDIREHTSYTSAAEAGKPTWSDVYISFLEPTLILSALHPVYNDNSELEGVLVAALRLDHIGQFLNQLKIGKTGQAFLIERNGTLLATSTPELPFTIDENDNRELLNAKYSNDPITQTATQYLFNQFGDLKNIDTRQSIMFNLKGDRYFLKLLPFADEHGLDWLIVVIVPESDFMAEINANIRTTIRLSIGAMIGAVIIGVLTARWITYPIFKLNTAASNLAKGNWSESLELGRTDELGELTEAFNSMAQQLQQSFDDLKSLNQALSESESKLTKFLNVLPVGVSVHDPEGRVIYFNNTAEELLGIEEIPDIDGSQICIKYQVYQAETHQIYPTEKLPALRALQGETCIVDDIEIERDGGRIALEVRGTPIFDDGGNIIYAIVAFEDITEQKRADKVLADYSRTLEAEVSQRTAELAAAHAEIMALNECLKAENLRLETELEVAQKLQQMILPKPEELSKICGFDVAGFMQPADEVGGDYYDIILQDGQLTIGIGDVTGHGLESGVLMLMAQTAVQTLLAVKETDPVKFLNAINQVIYSNALRMNSDKNLTLSFVNCREDKFYLSGQHETLIIVRNNGDIDQIDTLDLGFPIGLEEDISDFISQVEVKVNPGEIIVLYTDGIPEAINEEQEMYGMERLCLVLQQNRHESVHTICENVVKDVMNFIGTQQVLDDITLVVLKKTQPYNSVDLTKLQKSVKQLT
ncbi:MAG: SpoIIE family protein phosphatase [Arthrospira sp. SH-MAG29]|nr:SpoIIE family protein phosphatase [Arthrospira sp. SH-MAG29]MBS0015958.1 SpoIIE family protein phosphatase [Arthrospira sp. SH-MAG29]